MVCVFFFFLFVCEAVRERRPQSIMYCNVPPPPLLLLPRLGFLVIALLFDFSPLNQIDQDIHTKYTLSSDAELILIRSLTLGKVTGKTSSRAKC